MKRRDFLKLFSAATVATTGAQLVLNKHQAPLAVYEDFDISPQELAKTVSYMETAAPDAGNYLQAFQKPAPQPQSQKKNLQSYIAKMQNFEGTHQDDVFVSSHQQHLLLSTFKHLDRVQGLVGHGNFNVISFDEMVKFSDRYSTIGKFSPDELEFLESVFFDDVQKYGFFGEKVISDLTAVVPTKERYKVPYTGHFVYRGDSLKSYFMVRKDVGDSIILTSGIRSVVKQTHLFLAKVIQSKGNLSRASRSLAPPGHSFHGVGDYDVGKVGFGRRNFTSDFAKTDEFKKLVELGYINIRYPRDNLLGVRYEPWHIKVV